MTLLQANAANFPTPWKVVDFLDKVQSDHVEYRQTSLDTFQLRSPSHIIVINKEGFEIFKENDAKKWNKWLKDNEIESIPRVVFDD